MKTRLPQITNSHNSTFVVRIIRSEHGTWQGQLAHVQSGQVQYFQSCLQLIKMMDETCALTNQEDNIAYEEHYQVT